MRTAVTRTILFARSKRVSQELKAGRLLTWSAHRLTMALTLASTVKATSKEWTGLCQLGWGWAYRRCKDHSLMLGMIYGNFSGTPDEIGKMVEHTMQLRGDTARCIVTEESTGKDVYTLDNREGENHRVGRHIEQDLKKIDLNHPLMIAIKGRVDQICLDHLLCLSLTFLLLLEQNGLQRPTKIVWIIYGSQRI